MSIRLSYPITKGSTIPGIENSTKNQIDCLTLRIGKVILAIVKGKYYSFVLAPASLSLVDLYWKQLQQHKDSGI
jgi:hypothetical protein